jgi:hypothetical protein
MDITNILINCIENNKPISFSKYGDGEYYCMTRYIGRNCDNDTYTTKLGNALIESFKYVTDLSNNNFIGLWHDDKKVQVLQQYTNKNIKSARYHTLIFDGNFDYHNNRPYDFDYDSKKVGIYKAIRISPLKKIIVCNKLLMKSKLLFDADELVIVPFNNWFDTDFHKILNYIKDLIKYDGNHIVMTCCGMSAKVLIAELLKVYPNGIYLDFGSALDRICTKKESRGYKFTYEYLLDMLKDIIPNNWHDSQYDIIYNEAKYKLGIHLGQ